VADVTSDDLRAAVAAGTITEAQAASLLTTAQTRSGLRIAEDEPFELFKGFAEIFVAVGISILIAGIVGLTMLFDGAEMAALFYAGLAWALARYFTLKRRMMLPSIVLVCAYGVAVLALSSWVISLVLPNPSSILLPMVLTLLGVIGFLLLWYRAFRLPFTMFLVGLAGFGIALAISGNLDHGSFGLAGLESIFDLRTGSALPFGTLVFGLLALAAGLWFDMRDPHRLGRNSAAGFWLHILAAPALVNTVALTFFNMGAGWGYILLAFSLGLMAALALIIDRRSFLTAGIGYLIFLIGYVLTDPSKPGSWALVLFVVGLGLTGLGTFWTDLRLRLMRLLPDFPGKSRLPPYAKVTHD
jgi:hypothetical protein